MTTNPDSLAFDAEGKRLVCEVCTEWTDFADLYRDTEGTVWDICKSCGEKEENVS